MLYSLSNAGDDRAESVVARNARPAVIGRRAKLSQGLADPSRLALLDALRARTLAVQKIVERTEIMQPNASNHLRCLSECQLVAKERDGRHIGHRLSDTRGAALLRDADALLKAVPVEVKACGNHRRSQGRSSRWGAQPSDR